MTPEAFDGSAYRRTVLTPLRAAAPAGVDDLFWLGHVPRDADDSAQIAARLKATKAFLHKERSRPRQADVAAAVLREWPRVEGVLADPAARASLRARLGDAAPGAEVVGGAREAERASFAADGAAGPGLALEPAARRRRQVSTALGELARLRDEPELSEDLFAFLGLPVTATREMLRARVEKVGEVNRKRRPDRERSLVDELLMHSRELLVDGDPADYRAGLVADAAGPLPGASLPAGQGVRSADAAPTAAATAPVQAPPKVDTTRQAPAAKVDYTRRPKPQPQPQPASVESAGPAPPVTGLILSREGQGGLRVTWTWPAGVTEVVVATGPAGGPDRPGAGRKVTNAKYEIEGGVRLEGVVPGELVTVHTGRRDAAGVMQWNDPRLATGSTAP